MGDVSRDMFPARGCNNPEVLDICGRFSLSASPVVIAGRSYSVSYDGNGVFTVTTRFQWKDFVTGSFDVLSATLTDRAQMVSFSAASRQVSLQFQRAGSTSAGTSSEQILFRFALAQKGLALK
jgi:hypothetical protein